MSKTKYLCRMFASLFLQLLTTSAIQCHGTIQGVLHAAPKYLKDSRMANAVRGIPILASTTGKTITEQ